MERKIIEKILCTIVALLLLTLIAGVAPVLADSPKKIAVTVTDADNFAIVSGGVRYSETGEIAHINIVETGQVELHEADQSYLLNYQLQVHGNGPEGFTLDDGDKVAHDPNQGVFQVKEIWTYTNGNEEGTFSGVAHWTMSMPYISQYTSRLVLQGSGIFEGQTLSLEGNFGIDTDNTYYGYLLVH